MTLSGEHGPVSADRVDDRHSAQRRRKVVALAVVGALLAAAFLSRHVFFPDGRMLAGISHVDGISIVVRSAGDGQQSTCHGLPKPARVARFTKPVTIDEVVICSDPSGKDLSTVRSAATIAKLDALSKALAQPDDHPGAGSCNTGISGPPDFAVKVDGRWFRPTVPATYCWQVRPAAATALMALSPDAHSL